MYFQFKTETFATISLTRRQSLTWIISKWLFIFNILSWYWSMHAVPLLVKSDNSFLLCIYCALNTGIKLHIHYLTWSSWQPCAISVITPILQLRITLKEAECQNQNQLQVWLTSKPMRFHLSHPPLLLNFITTQNNPSSIILFPKYFHLTSIFPML